MKQKLQLEKFPKELEEKMFQEKYLFSFLRVTTNLLINTNIFQIRKSVIY